MKLAGVGHAAEAVSSWVVTGLMLTAVEPPVFTLRRRAGMTDDEFEADAPAVSADLQTLRRLI